jgi:hypothetical protein
VSCSECCGSRAVDSFPHFWEALSWHLSVTSSSSLLLISLSNEYWPGSGAADEKTTRHDLVGGNKATPELHKGFCGFGLEGVFYLSSVPSQLFNEW